jgi:choline-glycine betaine transporter
MIFMGTHGKNPAILVIAAGIIVLLTALQIVYRDELDSGTPSVAKCVTAGFSAFSITSAAMGKSLILKILSAAGFTNYTLDPLKLRQECGM